MELTWPILKSFWVEPKAPKVEVPEDVVVVEVPVSLTMAKASALEVVPLVVAVLADCCPNWKLEPLNAEPVEVVEDEDVVVEEDVSDEDSEEESDV